MTNTNYVNGRTLLQRLSEVMGDYWSGTVDSGTTQTIVDAELLDYSEDTNAILDWVMLETSTDGAAPQGEVRRINTYSVGPTIQTSRVFSASPAAGDTYSIHRVDPTMKIRALNRAARELYPQYLFREVISEDTIVDNLLLDPAFQAWSSTTALRK